MRRKEATQPFQERKRRKEATQPFQERNKFTSVLDPKSKDFFVNFVTKYVGFHWWITLIH